VLYAPNGSGLLGNLGGNVDNFSDDLRWMGRKGRLKNLD